jgi:protein-S-isoprenylcysteine O-methyltransferase Ste14
LKSSLTSINSWRADPTGWIGAAVMMTFGGVAAYRWSVSGYAFFGMMVIRDVAGAWFLLNRHPSRSRTRQLLPALVAYVSSALPLAYMVPPTDVDSWRLIAVGVMNVLGFSLSTLAMLDLGRSFGVSPAWRVRVTTGVYGLLKHPMYTGYVIAEIGMCGGNVLNLPILAVALGLYWVRARWEHGAELLQKKESRFC